MYGGYIMKSSQLALRAFVQISFAVAISATQSSFAENRLDSATTAEWGLNHAANTTEALAEAAKAAGVEEKQQGNEEEAKRWEERAKLWEDQAKEFREAQKAAKFAGDAVRSGNKLAQRAAKYQINKELSKVIPGGEVPPAVKDFIDNNLVEAAAAGNAYKSFQY